MRKLSKKEMQAVSGGDEVPVCLIWGQVYGHTECTKWGTVQQSCPTKKVWIPTGYNTGYWGETCA